MQCLYSALIDGYCSLQATVLIHYYCPYVFCFVLLASNAIQKYQNLTILIVMLFKTPEHLYIKYKVSNTIAADYF